MEARNGRPTEAEFSATLGAALAVPSGLADAKAAISQVVALVEQLKSQVTKYGALVPRRVPYLLSYFWEAGDRERFPILYPSSLDAFGRLGFEVDGSRPANTYESFLTLFAEIKDAVGGILSWEAEHFLIWVRAQPFIGVDPDAACGNTGMTMITRSLTGSRLTWCAPAS